MAFNPIAPMLEYANWIIKKYVELNKYQENNIFRVANFKKNAFGQTKLIIQIIGKSTVFECTPKEIVSDSSLLEGFSKSDVRTITYFACEQLNQPDYTISTQELDVKSNRAIFKLKKRGNKKTLSKTAAEITVDKILINNMAKEDICSISYLAGYEHGSNN
jgi:hypothetical protein